MVSILKVSKQTFCVALLTTVVVFFGVSFLNTSNHTRYLRQCACNEQGLVNNQRTVDESIEKEILNKRREVKEKSDVIVDHSTTHDGEGHDLQVDNSPSNVKQLSKIGEAKPQDRSDNISRIQGNTNTRSRPIGLVHLLDYIKYPCLPGSSQSKRLQPLNRCIRTVNVHLVADSVKSVECVKLQVGTSIPICIHDPRIDIFVSGSIFSTGVWEKDLLRIFVEALRKVKDIVVLDIGCNIGLYTLVAAREGKRVVSIDANVQNLRLLSKSLILGQLTENVTLIWSALSDTYTNVSLKPEPFNVGAFSVNTDFKSISGNDFIIETVLLDDLMYLFEGKPVGIKMDVELFELHVLKGGVTILKNIDVRFIQIEIGHHRKRRSGQGIVIILRYFGFTPFANCLGNINLVDLPVKGWPFDVCFIKDMSNNDDAG